ncbi:MAG: histidine phosphatase family protein [Lachnospiraceae bacterium]|nr:histidine phosphatase family protein [Lachnospiraceae bacterium]
MQRIYLVRHGVPDTGTSERICLGRKDIPLGQKGREEINRLSGYFYREEIADKVSGIFCSPLKRCVETAEILHNAVNRTSESFKITEAEDLQEVNTGIWDGLTFKEIKERFPQEYEERGKSLGRYRISGGETLEEAGIRFLYALKNCMVNTEGNLIVVAHAGVIRSFLCLITGKDVDQINDWKIPYGSVTEVLWEVDHEKYDGIQGPDAFKWIIEKAGFLPVETMTMEQVETIWRKAATTGEQKAHMRATAEYAMELAEQVPTFSERDKTILYYSALLHDMLRSMGRGHEVAGADWLLKNGHVELAEPVRMHNNAEVFHSGEMLTVAEILYYADKRCRGNQIVTIQERFDSSRKKIRDEVGRKKNRERMEAAFAIEEKLKREIKR